MPNNEHKPVIIALVVCDNIYSEPGGKSALVGLFDNIRARTLPAKHPKLAVYVSVTDVEPGSHAKLDIVHAETDALVVSGEGPFPADTERLDIVDMQFVLNNVAFREAGLYFVRFFCNGHILVQRPLRVIVPSESTPTPKEG